MTNLAGTTALITGAGGGIGRELVRQFAESGSRLILTDLSADTVEEVLQTTGVADDRIAAIVPADLSNPAGVDTLHNQVLSLGTPVDVLVNNAGVATIGRFSAVPTNRWQTLMQVNLVAPMQLTHCLLPSMLARGRGHIVNISSVAGFVGIGQLVAYSSSKFGLRGFSKALAADVEKHGVRVSTVYPFFARTSMLESETFGDVETSALPDRFIHEPAWIVKKLIQGIRKNKRHICPGVFPRVAWSLDRFAPWLVEYLCRR